MLLRNYPKIAKIDIDEIYKVIPKKRKQREGKEVALNSRVSTFPQRLKALSKEDQKAILDMAEYLLVKK